MNFAALIKDHQKKELERLMLTSKMSKTNFLFSEIILLINIKHSYQFISLVHLIDANLNEMVTLKFTKNNNLRMQLLNLACGNELNMHYQIKMRNSLYSDAEIIVKKWWWWWRKQYKWIRKQGTHRHNKLKNFITKWFTVHAASFKLLNISNNICSNIHTIRLFEEQEKNGKTFIIIVVVVLFFCLIE